MSPYPCSTDFIVICGEMFQLTYFASPHSEKNSLSETVVIVINVIPKGAILPELDIGLSVAGH
jgi:hypothetical protein